MIKLKIRSTVIAPKDHVLVSWDLSQAESWVVAYLANEPSMKYALQNGDIHSHTAANALYNIDISQVTSTMRYNGKRTNHASAYGMSYLRFVQIYNKESDKPPFLTITNKEGKDMLLKWHSYYTNIKQEWWPSIQDELTRNNRRLSTPYGRERTFYQPWGDELFKSAYSHKPQGGVADHFTGMVQPELGLEGGYKVVHTRFVKTKIITIINMSHDSIMAEVHKKDVGSIIPEITSIIQRPMIVNGEQFTIPVDCEIGERWGEMEKQKRAA